MGDDECTVFLAAPASLDQKWTAIQLNVNAWYARSAAAHDTHTVEHLEDILLTSEHATIPAESSLQDDERIDYILDWYRQQRPVRPVIIWYLNGTPPTQLGARLLARGVSTNWKPHWMWRELKTDAPEIRQDSSYEIRVLEPADVSSSANAEGDRAIARLAGAEPRQVWQIGAFRGREQLGKCVLNITVGEYGVGGLFDMEVVEEERRKGIGAALTAAACKLGREKGCHHVFLNATEMGEPLYRRGGFQSMGFGCTWHLPESFYTKSLPSKELVKFLEGIARGDVAMLNQFGKHFSPNQLKQQTANDMTPLELAVHCRQPESASWLINHGVTPDIISLWDLGWKDKARALITRQPELVNRTGGQEKTTPLHIAVERDDAELAQLLLTVPNDLSIKDAIFNSTALGWSQYLQREKIRKLIQQHVASEEEVL